MRHATRFWQENASKGVVVTCTMGLADMHVLVQARQAGAG